jgi:hypothetical protein
MIGVLFASLALFAAADPAPAPATAPPPASAKTVDQAVVQGKAKDDPTQMVCKTEIPVGSRLPVKKCMTKAEAEMRKFEDRQELERAQGDTYRR